MKLWLEVFASIGWNLCVIVGQGVSRAWSFLRLTTVFAAVWWILTIPYEVFRKLNPEGRVDLTTYVASKDKAGAALIEMLFLPYNIYLESTEFMGESQHDKDVLRVWFTITWISIPSAIFFVRWIVKHYGS